MGAFRVHSHVSMSLLVLLALFLKHSSAQVSTPFSSSVSPALTFYKGVLYLLYRDDSSHGLMYSTSFDNGNTWSESIQIPGIYTSDGPGAAVSSDGNVLNVFARDPSGSQIFHVVYTPQTAWANPTSGVYWIGTDMDNAPSPAVANTGQFSGRICVVGSDAGGSAVMYNTMDANGNIISKGNTGYDQGQPPGIVWYNNAFHVFFMAGNGVGMMHISSSDGVSWGSLYQLGNVNLNSIPSAVVYNSNIYLFYRSTDNSNVCIGGDCGQYHAWYSFSSDVGTWSSWTFARPPFVTSFQVAFGQRVAAAVQNAEPFVLAVLPNDGSTIKVIIRNL